MPMSKFQIVALTAISVALAACDHPPAPAQQARPVRAVVAQFSNGGETLSFTGQIRARDEVNLAFRLDGRVVERLVNVGDSVAANQVIGRINPQIQENDLRAARASLAAAQSTLTEARRNFWRQQELLAKGFASEARFDQARQAQEAAAAQVESAQAQLRTAQERMSYTELRATAAGTVIAVGAWPGEVVQAGQMVVQVALHGGRDAVFDMPAVTVRAGLREPTVDVALTDDASVKAIGQVREVAPQADPATRTYRVKVGLANAPEGMRLGATVTGRIQLSEPPCIKIPASALIEANGGPAVWVIDRESQTVALRSVQVQRYEVATVVIARGLEAGDVVVSAGVQALHPGQKIRLPGAVL